MHDHLGDDMKLPHSDLTHACRGRTTSLNKQLPSVIVARDACLGIAGAAQGRGSPNRGCNDPLGGASDRTIETKDIAVFVLTPQGAQLRVTWTCVWISVTCEGELWGALARWRLIAEWST